MFLIASSLERWKEGWVAFSGGGSEVTARTHAWYYRLRKLSASCDLGETSGNLVQPLILPDLEKTVFLVCFPSCEMDPKKHLVKLSVVQCTIPPLLSEWLLSFSYAGSVWFMPLWHTAWNCFGIWLNQRGFCKGMRVFFISLLAFS